MDDQTKFPCIPPTKPEYFVQVLSEVEDYNLKLMNIPEMWKRTKGKGVRVAVLDTGTPTHDDVPVKGKFSAVPNYLYDENGHGTAVSSMIGAIAGNGMGIAGIAPECELYTCAVLDKNGTGSSEWIAAGIRWAVDVAQAHIINMSLGMPGYPISQRIKDACQYAYGKGVTLIAASGNEHGAICQPGIYDTVISVGAVDKDKKPADFSNMGEQLDFVAGGVSCYMAYLHNGYAKQSGTCLKEGTLIYTPTGPVAIEHVKPGTEVYAYKDGRVVRRIVTANLNQGKNTVYRVLSRGRGVWATNTHKFLTINQDTKEISWTPLNELTKKHRFPLKVGFDVDVNPYLDKVIPDDLAWLMGFFLGDGWLCHVEGDKTHGSASRVQFANGIDVPLIEKVKSIYYKYVGKQLKDNKEATWSHDDSTRVACLIENIGLGGKANSKTLPLWLWSLSKEKRYAFYRGYTEADGNDSKVAEDGTILKTSYECVSESLLHRVMVMADYDGFMHSKLCKRVRPNKAPNSKSGKFCTSYCTTVHEYRPPYGANCMKTTNSDHKVITEIKGKDVLLSYFPDGDFCLGLWEIEEGTEHEANVYDLTVPDADCFVAEGLIVHNSFASPAIAGLAALIISDALNADPPQILTPAQVQDGIQKISMDLGTVGKDIQTGYGVPIFGYTNPAFNIPQLPPPSPEATLKESSLSLATRANDLASKLSNPAAVSETLLFLSGELKAAAEAIVKKEQP